MSYGLIAGVEMPHIMQMKPGMVIDLYIYRQRYDDEQHSIKRQRKLLMD